MSEYWDRPRPTGAAIVDGWFSTYDIGCVDDDGNFYIAAEKGPW
jgi:long-chain acyl-CoA synthetase